MTLHLFNEKIDEAVLPFGYKPPRLGVLAEPVCKRLRDSILSPFFHSYIFAMYKNEALWI